MSPSTGKIIEELEEHRRYRDLDALPRGRNTYSKGHRAFGAENIRLLRPMPKEMGVEWVAA
jgi:hypothetical protein